VTYDEFCCALGPYQREWRLEANDVVRKDLSSLLDLIVFEESNIEHDSAVVIDCEERAVTVHFVCITLQHLQPETLARVVANHVECALIRAPC
jgi:hypothetical protein